MIKTRLATAAGALLLAGAVLSVAGPAFADGTTTTSSTSSTSTTSSTSSTLVPCTPATSAPLYTARCAPTVATSSGQVTVTLPGVGSITFLVNPDGTVNTSTAPSVSVTGANFSAGTPKVSADGTHISVSFVNIASPEQHYTIKVKLSPPTSAGAGPQVQAVAGPNKNKGHHHDDGHKGDGHKGDSNDDHDRDDGQAPPPPGNNGPAPLAQHSPAPWAAHGHGDGGGD